MQYYRKKDFALGRSLLIYLIFLLAALTVDAQYEPTQFQLHSVKNGLSHNYVTSIEQDALGYMWIGTDGGLNRFDGNSFTAFNIQTAPLFMSSGIIRHLKPMGPDRIGLISRGGFQILNTRNLRIDNYLVPDSTEFSVQRNMAWDALQLPDSSVAITTAVGFYVFDRYKKLRFRHDAFTINDLGRKRMLYGRYMLLLDKENLLVLVRENGLAHYNIRTNKFVEFVAGDSSQYNLFPLATAPQRGLIHHLVVSPTETLFFHFAANSIVYYDRQTGSMVQNPLPLPKDQFSWFTRIFRLSDTVFAVNGGNAGFYTFHLDLNTGKIRFDTKSNLEQFKVLCIKPDRNGRLWIGTSKGLLQEKESNPFINTSFVPVAPTEKNGDGLNCVYRYQDKLYVGTASYYSGLLVLDEKTKQVQKRVSFFQQPSAWNEIISIQRYHGDTLFIGTQNGLLWYDTQSSRYGKVPLPATVTKPLNTLTAPGKDGYAWICSLLNGELVRYHIATRSFKVFNSTTKPAIPFEKVKSMVYDSNGDLWLGGLSLARWNSRKEQFDTLITVYGGANKFNNDIIQLTADTKGSLWMHNAENGLLEYRINQRRWVAYGLANGLPSLNFESMSAVEGENIWMASSGHLTCFNIEKKELIIYDINDGYPDEGPKEKIIFGDTVGQQLFLLARRNLSVFPMQPALHEEPKGGIVIQELRINNERSLYHPEGAIELDYNENNLSLFFTVIDYSNSSYRFQYKMSENGDWINLDAVRSITLSGLQPGSYTISLRAIGKWGAQQQQIIRLKILEPWWRSVTFLLTMAALLLLISVGLYRYRIGRIRARANLDKKLAHTEMMALHAQMNPHFISNSLNSIREMILNEKNQEASRFLTRFAHLIRITLEQSLQPFISLRQTMDYLNRYAEMEHIRTESFRFTQTVSEAIDPDEVRLPPMLIQPFIENSIWHGSANGEIDIKVSFTEEGDQLICVVEDNGIGIRQSLHQKQGLADLHQSVGIDNIRHRIQLLNEKYEMFSLVEIVDRSEADGAGQQGTRVTIKLPLKQQSV